MQKINHKTSTASKGLKLSIKKSESNYEQNNITYYLYNNAYMLIEYILIFIF